MYSNNEYNKLAYKHNANGYRKDIPQNSIERFYQGGFQSRVTCNRCHKPDNVQMNLVQFIYSKMYCLSCLQIIAKSERRVVAGGKFSRPSTHNNFSRQQNLQEKVITRC